MFSTAELNALSKICRGSDTVRSLEEAMGVTRAQVYWILRSLKKKGILHLNEGRIVIESKTHVALLVNVLRRSNESYKVLSGRGMDVLSELVMPRTVVELSETMGVHQTTISAQIKKMMSLSMLRRDGARYSINEPLWSELAGLAAAYRSYNESNDPRVIPGSRIYFVSKDLAVFSNDSETGDTKTAFSRYTEFGIGIRLVTNYYCNLKRELTVSDVFLHSLHIISNNDDWWLRMIALIFYVKHKDELKGVEHKMKDEMDIVLTGSRVNGWVPLREMQERADMYGVRL
jgi:predicted transcriptional regulator